MAAPYSTRISKADQEIRKHTKKIQLLAFSRLGVLLGGAAGLFQIAQYELVFPFVSCFLLVLLGFFFLVFKQSQQVQKKKYWEDFRRINQNEIEILAGKANLYEDGTYWERPIHAYSSDLDILGAGSLFAFVNRCATFLGREKFSNQLLGDHLPTSTEIPFIQDKVKKLASELDWCQDFQVALWAHVELKSSPLPVLQYYLEKAPSFLNHVLLHWWIRLAPFLMLGLAIGAFFQTIFLGFFTLLGIMQLLVSLAFAGKVSQWVQQAENIQKIFSSYADALKQIELREGKDYGSAIFKMLDQIVGKLNYRNNVLVGSILNILMLWDFRQILAFEKWRTTSSQAVYRGLEIITDYEVLVSLATLHRNHPNWAFPEIVDKENGHLVLDGRDLGHPLIPQDRSVVNDYQNHDHQLALVTGSNMAGKSTFLRTIGSNLVLAYMGAPICGTYLKTSLFKLISFMRIKDSLIESTSTFKAELDRIQWVLHEAAAHQDTFVLVDEMLRGTNSVDKYLGSKAIIKRFLKQGTYGLIATHDLKLAELESEYPHQLKNYHFDIQMVDQDMQFDYLLKTGACTKFNAAILLKGIGVDIDAN